MDNLFLHEHLSEYFISFFIDLYKKILRERERERESKNKIPAEIKNIPHTRFFKKLVIWHTIILKRREN